MNSFASHKKENYNKYFDSCYKNKPDSVGTVERCPYVPSSSFHQTPYPMCSQFQFSLNPMKGKSSIGLQEPRPECKIVLLYNLQCSKQGEPKWLKYGDLRPVYQSKENFLLPLPTPISELGEGSLL